MWGSSTNREMLASNQPNACNLCHLEQPIGWTLRQLDEWYGLKLPESVFDAYLNRGQPVGEGWLDSSYAATRLVTGDAMIRARAVWALPGLLKLLEAGRASRTPNPPSTAAISCFDASGPAHAL